jgi:hypothetical protein
MQVSRGVCCEWDLLPRPEEGRRDAQRGGRRRRSPEEAAAGAPQPMSMPALIDLDNWPKTGTGGVLAR